jgi:hypothetical protein
MQYVNPNKLSDAVCNIYDVKNTISSVGLNNLVKDNEGTEITIGDCIHDILLFLEELEANSPYKDDDDPIQDSDIARTKVPALDVNGKFIYNEGSTA